MEMARDNGDPIGGIPNAGEAVAAVRNAALGMKALPIEELRSNRAAVENFMVLE
jgi:hypothetical protein